jgi:hypothetical protein
MVDVGDADEFIDTFIVMEGKFGRGLQHLRVCDESKVV